MTRSERLRLEGKSDSMYYGTLPIVTMDYIRGNEDVHYEESDLCMVSIFITHQKDLYAY